MRKKHFTAIALCLSGLMLFTGTKMKAENPFMAAYDTPFNIPPFEQISTDDYLPAFEEGIRQHNQEINSIINNRALPDFDNTIVALDNAGQLLENVNYVFAGLSESMSTPEMQKLGAQIFPMLSKHSDLIVTVTITTIAQNSISTKRKKDCSKNTTKLLSATELCCRLKKKSN